MPTFLHKPARDGAAVAELKAAKAPEDQHLEFKGGFWEDEIRRCKACKQETALQGSGALQATKDVAAMANALGGDIIVGVDDTGDQASGWWGGKPIPNDADETVLRWLKNHLAPREASDAVEVKLITAKDRDDGSEHRALVVNVPPWGHGPVAVQTEIDPQRKVQYFFPVRRGRETFYLSFEEIMRLNEASRRSIYLLLCELTGSVDGKSGEQRFHLATPVYRRTVTGALEPFNAYSRKEREDGFIEKFDQRSLLVKMTGQEFDDSNPALRQMKGYERLLSVPLELIQTAWRAPEEPRYLTLALSATAIWAEDRWDLDLGRHEPR